MCECSRRGGITYLLMNTHPPVYYMDEVMFSRRRRKINNKSRGLQSHCYVDVKTNYEGRGNNSEDYYVSYLARLTVAQCQDCQPECWEAWGPEFNPRPWRVGIPL